MVIMPKIGGYWIDGVTDPANRYPSDVQSGEEEFVGGSSERGKPKLETDHFSKAYRKHFLGKVGLTLSHKIFNKPFDYFVGAL